MNFSRTRANDNVNCTAVNLNPENFPLSFVNLCTDGSLTFLTLDFKQSFSIRPFL